MRVALPFIFLFLLAVYPTSCKSLFGRRRCMSKDIKHIIAAVVDEVSTSPDFGSSIETPGIIANILKRRVELRFTRVYEIIVSRKNFALASHSIGDKFCKLFKKGIYALAYETPHQAAYKAKDTAAESEFSSISDLDPLGTSNSLLPGQVKALGVALETDGYRLGFPKGSHCDEKNRGGNICCHQELFQSMHNTVVNMEEDDSYFSVDRRVIAKRIRREAELAVNQPLELLVSPKDFVVTSNHRGNCVCKFKAGENTIMAWRTPGNWSIGVEQFADNGRSAFRGCNRTERSVGQRMKRNGCCNQTLQYAMTKNLEEAADGMDGGETDINEISRALARSTQKQLNSHVETVVSRGPFVHRAMNASMADQACKLELLQYQVLMFQSPGKPLDTEFLSGDVEPSTQPESIMPKTNPKGGESAKTGGQNPSPQNQAIKANPSSQPTQPAQPPQQNAVNQQNPAQQAPPQQVSPQQTPLQQASQQAPSQQAPPQQSPVQQAPPQQDPLQQASPPRVLLQQAPSQPAAPQQAVIQQPQGVPSQSFGAPQSPYYGPENTYIDPWLYRYRCFSEDTWVITETGKKNMSELNIGDFVMTANSRESFFLPIISWLHKNEDVNTEFVEVSTSERQLFISPRHFIYRANCSDIHYHEENVLVLPKTGEIYAEELVLGECLYVYHEEKWQVEKILTLKMRKKRGLYAPLTENGKIVVNGILASCFTDIREPIIQNVYFDFISKIRKYLKRLLGWYGDGQVGVPNFLHVFEDLVRVALPHSNRF